MSLAKRMVVAAILLLATSSAGVHAQTSSQPAPQQQQAPKQLEKFEYVPLDQLPPQEQIPAANLLIPAYAFVWIAVLVYVMSLAKRLGTVQREVERLETDLKQGKHS
jgi:CcmD family protein